MKKILIWGNGGYYKSKKNWIPRNWNVLAFIHGQPSSNTFEGKKVILPTEIFHFEFDFIIVAVYNYEPMVEILRKLNVPKEKIYLLNYHYEWFFEANEKKKITMFYEQASNVGDILNAFLYELLYGIRIELADVNTAETIGIGSILDLVYDDSDYEKSTYEEKPITVIGSGLMYEVEGKKKFKRELLIKALRGEKTRKSISGILNKNIECVLADPGLLVSKLNIKTEKIYRIGIVPHYVDFNNPLLLELAKQYKNAIYIDVTKEPMSVIKEIASCNSIISSSLHGLIIADSFGIPNMWIECSNNVLGNGYKFYDYYSSYGINVEPFDLRKEKNIPCVDEIRKRYKIPQTMVESKQKDLERVLLSL